LPGDFGLAEDTVRDTFSVALNIFQESCPSLSSAGKFVCRFIEGPLRRAGKLINTTTKKQQI
jgi:hypothetical protein